MDPWRRLAERICTTFIPVQFPPNNVIPGTALRIITEMNLNPHTRASDLAVTLNLDLHRVILPNLRVLMIENMVSCIDENEDAWIIPYEKMKDAYVKKCNSMNSKIISEIEHIEVFAKYDCSGCLKSFDSLESDRLMTDDGFRCPSCNSILYESTRLLQLRQELARLQESHRPLFELFEESQYAVAP